ncbi:metallophosphoesterase family protein [Paenibacillus sp. R14(2021)]|uniref:metallophosphoesterase family protein n=1 Tax=Paenibacillus sp. R14(2021) TaxID=2859228 RepID=UPI001C61448E|nr:metallophosphoesterase family protein [Paenibacillus sp. R14(2021)]
MTRILMISDVHGCAVQLDELLKLVNYRADEDQLMLLGDYVDRGPQSKETVELVMELTRQPNVIALRGNHDQRLVDLAISHDPEVPIKFMEHGGLTTLQSYAGIRSESFDPYDLKEFSQYLSGNYAKHIAFLQGLPLYHENLQHIYVHAGLNPLYANWKEQPEHDFMNIKGEFLHVKTVVDRLVIFGHTRTSELQDSAAVWFGGDKIGIDGGCAYGQQLNALIYEQGTYSSAFVRNRKGDE